MKKILSFLTLFVFIIINSSHNLFMTFADFQNIDSEMNMMKMDHCTGNSNSDSDSQKCILKCLEKAENNKNIQSNTNELKLGKIVFLFYKNFLDVNLFSISELDKSFFKINSPPFLNKKNSNYAYHNLIKIIKSNT